MVILYGDRITIRRFLFMNYRVQFTLCCRIVQRSWIRHWLTCVAWGFDSFKTNWSCDSYFEPCTKFFCFYFTLIKYLFLIIFSYLKCCIDFIILRYYCYLIFNICFEFWNSFISQFYRWLPTRVLPLNITCPILYILIF